METKNGSAVDGAIGVTLCLGVVSPQSSGLGGGMFMTIYSGNRMYTINARESAPENVNSETYENNPQASRTGKF
jgi:gamma-glutamyltranspeptidase